MNKYVSGIVAGFIATVVLSILMVIKKNMGVEPALNPVSDIMQFLGTTNMIVGWVGHFILGSVVWGIIFVIIKNILPGKYWWRGILYGIILWLVMMVIYMPVMGWGFFAMKLGGKAVVMTLVLHVIYGFVLGLVYGGLVKKKSKSQ